MVTGLPNHPPTAREEKGGAYVAHTAPLGPLPRCPGAQGRSSDLSPRHQQPHLLLPDVDIHDHRLQARSYSIMPSERVPPERMPPAPRHSVPTLTLQEALKEEGELWNEGLAGKAHVWTARTGAWTRWAAGLPLSLGVW